MDEVTPHSQYWHQAWINGLWQPLENKGAVSLAENCLSINWLEQNNQKWTSGRIYNKKNIVNNTVSDSSIIYELWIQTMKKVIFVV